MASKKWTEEKKKAVAARMRRYWTKRRELREAKQQAEQDKKDAQDLDDG